jgi:[ribosomal protein S18]-alanine N-acetyltransferase
MWFKPMTREYTEQICGWKYEAPYDFYNMDITDECEAELLNGEYYGVFDALGKLIGFFCYGLSARVPGGYEAGIYQAEDRIDDGLGMAPSLTGCGQGSKFVTAGLEFAAKKLGCNKLRLVVACFNSRAIEVYRKNGFRSKETFFCDVDGRPIPFLLMEN